MATLNVTGYSDFRGTAFPEPITEIVFSGASNVIALFGSSQFGGSQISRSVQFATPENLVPGGAPYRTVPAVTVFMEAAGGGRLDARGWNLADAQLGASFLTVSGSDFNDTVYGTSKGDWVNLGLGSNVVYGGQGDDFLYMGDDVLPDTISGGSGSDYLNIKITAETADLVIDISDGGRGRDIGNGTRIAGIEQIVISSGLGDDTLTGGTGNATIYGNDGNDRITAGLRGNQLFGEDGNDTLVSNRATDNLSLSGGDGIDTLILNRSTSSIGLTYDLSTVYSTASMMIADDFEILHFKGGSGGDSITAGALADDLSGGVGRDILIGGAGEDIINGGKNADTLTGGADADTFVFGGRGTAAKGAGADIITDFEQGTDVIDISAVNGLVFIGTSQPGINLAEIGFRQTATDTIISVMVDADDNGVNEINYEIRLTGLFTLTADDFVL